MIPQFGSLKAPLAWYELKNGAWVKHVVSQQSYVHGIGVGDRVHRHRLNAHFLAGDLHG